MLFCGINIVFLWGFTLFGVKCLDTPGSGVFVFCSLIGSYVVSLTSLFWIIWRSSFIFNFVRLFSWSITLMFIEIHLMTRIHDHMGCTRWCFNLLMLFELEFVKFILLRFSFFILIFCNMILFLINSKTFVFYR